MIKKKYLSAEIIKQFADRLGLAFVDDNEPEGNVCFANNEEVRAEFKTAFTAVDLMDYFSGASYSRNYRENQKEIIEMDFAAIPIPSDLTQFWKLVELGASLRNNEKANNRKR